MNAPFPAFDGTQTCAQVDPEVFFPETGNHGKAAKDLCNDCAFKAPCLEYALHNAVDGVWGGTSDGERGRIRKERDIVPVPVLIGDREYRRDTVRRMDRMGYSTPEIAGVLGIADRSVQKIRSRMDGAA